MLQVACQSFLDPDDVECDCDALSDGELEEIIDAASDVIAILSGGAVTGRCCEVVRPRRVDGPVCGCFERFGRWGQACSCQRLQGITLRGPNPEITGVLLDGEQFIDHAIVDGRLLVRTDGKYWPGCQSVTRSTLDRGTLEIQYSYGLHLDHMMKSAAAEIVCWLIKNPAQGEQKVPVGTRGISVAGVQITLDTVLSEVKRKTFLLPHTTRLLTVYAPNGSQPPFVYSPELEDGWQLHRVT